MLIKLAQNVHNNNNNINSLKNNLLTFVVKSAGKNKLLGFAAGNLEITFPLSIFEYFKINNFPFKFYLLRKNKSY